MLYKGIGGPKDFALWTLPAVLHKGSCYIKAMLYKAYTTVAAVPVAS